MMRGHGRHASISARASALLNDLIDPECQHYCGRHNLKSQARHGARHGPSEPPKDISYSHPNGMINPITPMGPVSTHGRANFAFMLPFCSTEPPCRSPCLESLLGLQVCQVLTGDQVLKDLAHLHMLR